MSVPVASLLFVAVVVCVQALIIYRLLSLLELRDLQIAALKRQYELMEGIAKDLLLTPHAGANSSGPHEDTDSQKSANGK